MAVHYDISSLDSNKTILETLHDIQKYLKANPIYKVYYANGSYTIGQAQYSISLLGNNQGQIAEGDVVFFNNNFYAKISSVGTETFSVFPATAIQGSGGAQIKTMSQLEFLNVLSLLYDDNAGAHINMSGRTEYTDGTETPNTLELLVPFVPKDNSIKFETSEDFEKVKVSLNSKVVSNPNLLINPDFAINQREQSSYTGTSNAYTVDRWAVKSGATVLVGTNGITIANGYGIYQSIEGFSKLLGKKITLSIKVTSLTGSFKLGMAGGTGATSQATNPFTDGSGDVSFDTVGIHSITRTLKTSDVFTNAYLNFYIVANESSSVSIEWAKLEVGELATEFIPPLIAEELPKCQRYYQRFTGGGTYHVFSTGWVRTNTTSNNLRFVLSLPNRLRVKPTFAYSGNFGSSSVGSNLPITDISMDGSSSIDVITLLASSSQTTAGQCCGLVSNNDSTAYIELDAEIY